MSLGASATPIPDNECLSERKYWCFLLSSIFTFLAGIFLLLIWRAFAFLCCRSKESSEFKAQAQQEKEKLAAAQQGQPPGGPKSRTLMEGNFVTEAKDWAGELISGQTTTGRILVCTKSSKILSPIFAFFFKWNLFLCLSIINLFLTPGTMEVLF